MCLHETRPMSSYLAIRVYTSAETNTTFWYSNTCTCSGAKSLFIYTCTCIRFVEIISTYTYTHMYMEA